MSNIIESLYNIRILDELAEKRTIIHNVHPLIKVLTTCIYLIVTVSFDKYEISGLLPLALYPAIIIALADIPMTLILKRILVSAPFMIGMGVLNPLFDKSPVVILPWIQITGGWISFCSLLFRGSLTILSVFILIATTGMTKITLALQIMRIPKLFIIQLLLTYRYISVLFEEVGRTVCAYSLRSPGKKGIRFGEWGSLTGRLLISTLERSQRVYHAMCCRGFAGEYNVGSNKIIGIGDIVYFAVWSAYFILIRYFNVSAMIGSLMTGVGR